MNRDISVLMSVYQNDKSEYIIESIESVINQTLPPKQLVIVIDGPVGEGIKSTLESLRNKYHVIEVYQLDENVGLGRALRFGMEKCRYELIARMDSDDLSMSDRFMKQVNCFENDASLDVVGSCGLEFITHTNNSMVKSVPKAHEDIVKFMKSRCPFCHMSVMMKKSAVESAGGYLDYYYAEDWYLWIRMCLNGARFYNIQENLVNIRVDHEFYRRRSGIKLYNSTKNLLKYMREHKMIGFFRYRIEKIKRFIGYVMTPNWLREKIYRKYMRKTLR